MDVLEATKDLVYEILDVVIGEIVVGSNNPLQIGVHQIKDNVAT